MGTNIAIREESWVNDDGRWMAHRKGRDTARSITLDLSLFHANHHLNGFLPSGMVIAKLTSSGLYGPYSPLLSNGLQTPIGHLFTPAGFPAAETTGKVAAAYVWEGIVKKSFLPAFTGGASALGILDAGAETALSKFMKYE